MTLTDQNTLIDIYRGDTVTEAVCDMQPYDVYSEKGKLTQEEYGLDIKRVMRIYTATNLDITEGAKIALRGEKPIYIVGYAEHWKDYTMALLTLIPQGLQDESVDMETGENDLSDIYGGGFY